MPGMHQLRDISLHSTYHVGNCHSVVTVLSGYEEHLLWIKALKASSPQIVGVQKID